MKTVMKFQCDKCRRVYDTPGEALTCEAAHYGLTREEYDKWLALKKLAAEAGKINGIRKNAQTDMNFDVAVNKLVSFEKEHQLLDK